MKDETDAGLLEWIGNRSDPEFGAEASDAFQELHRRHAKPLYAMLKEWADARPYVGLDVDALVSETFRIAVEKAGAFRVDPGDSPEVIAKRVHGWLQKIARFRIYTEFRRERAGMEPIEFNDAAFLNAPELDLAAHSQVAEEVEPVLDELSERDREMALLVCEFGSGAIPADIQAAYIRRFGSNEAWFRQVKKRVLERLRVRLAPFLKNSPMPPPTS